MQWRNYLPGAIIILAIIAIWIDIPHHRYNQPFGYPGISIALGDQKWQKEIKTHLGLDLQGGTQLVLQLDTSKNTSGKSVDELNSLTRTAIERRINTMGVAEPVIQQLGGDKIIIELPGVTNLDEARETAEKQAYLEFKLQSNEDQNNPTYQSLDPPLTGANLKPTTVEISQGQVVILFEFQGNDAQRWGDMTSKNINKRIQIVLDGQELSAPVVKGAMPEGKGQIEGKFTIDEAKKLSNLINSGALPVPVKEVQSTKVEATLGTDAVKKSAVAGAIGLGIVALFMILYYRLPGALAVIALILYTLLVYAIFRLIPVTLTLAGIAGFILSIGMAVDANVLTFERLKEELRAGRSLRAAVDAGWERARPSILYSNGATLITCAVLWQFGTGTIKGFALTLAIGVIVSLFSAITVTQTLLHYIIKTDIGRDKHNFGVGEG